MKNNKQNILMGILDLVLKTKSLLGISVNNKNFWNFLQGLEKVSTNKIKYTKIYFESEIELGIKLKLNLVLMSIAKSSRKKSKIDIYLWTDVIRENKTKKSEYV